MPIGVFSRVESPVFTIEGPERGLVIVDRALRGEDGGRALRVIGGDGPVEVRIGLLGPAEEGETLRLRARRLSRQGRFTASLAARGDGATRRRDLVDEISRDSLLPLEFELPVGATAVTLELDSERAVGLLLDDLERAAPAPMEVTSASLARRALPVTAESGAPMPLGAVEVTTRGALAPLTFEAIEVRLEGALELTAAETSAAGTARAFERQESGWWRAPLGLRATCAPLALDLAGRVVRGDDAGAGRLARDALGSLEARIVLAGVDAPLRAAPLTLTRGLCSATRIAGGAGLAVESTALAPYGITQREPGALVGVAGLRDRAGRPFVRTLRWTPEGELSERDLRPDDPALGYARPVLLLDRRTGEGLVAVEEVPWERGDDPPGPLVAFRTDDGGETFGAPAPLGVVDDDDASLIGGHLRLAPGRAVIEGTTWAVPILRSHGDRAVQAALLVSEDGGATWIVSTGVHDGARGASAVALGEGAILVEAWGEPRAPRAEASTLNGGVWWLGMSDTRPARPASPEGTAWVHVGRETGWGADARLLYASAPDDAPHGLALRGSNDFGAIWHVHRRAVLDDREGAGAPGLALVDADRIAVLFRSGTGDLLLQVRDLTPHAGPLQSFEGALEPR